MKVNYQQPSKGEFRKDFKKCLKEPAATDTVQTDKEYATTVKIVNPVKIDNARSTNTHSFSPPAHIKKAAISRLRLIYQSKAESTQREPH